jgi:histidyl-tRNA synthetase
VGFAYGLERIAAAVEPPERPLHAGQGVLVVAVSDDEYPYALEVARQLRARGYIVAVDVRGRNVSSNLRDAARRDTAYVAIVGNEEHARNELVWRDLSTRAEQRLPLEALPTFAADRAG